MTFISIWIWNGIWIVFIIQLRFDFKCQFYWSFVLFSEVLLRFSFAFKEIDVRWVAILKYNCRSFPRNNTNHHHQFLNFSHDISVFITKISNFFNYNEANQQKFNDDLRETSKPSILQSVFGCFLVAKKSEVKQIRHKKNMQILYR